jgi:hypothetical protein
VAASFGVTTKATTSTCADCSSASQQLAAAAATVNTQQDTARDASSVHTGTHAKHPNMHKHTVCPRVLLAVHMHSSQLLRPCMYKLSTNCSSPLLLHTHSGQSWLV